MNTPNPHRGHRTPGIRIDAPVTGSVISNDSVVKNVWIHATAAGSATRRDLRDAVASLRAAVEAEDGDQPSSRHARYELEAIEEELARDEPDTAVLGARWRKAHTLLEPLQQVASIAQLTDRVLSLLGLS